MKKKLSHLNADGQPAMVDVSKKETTARQAIASGKVAAGMEVMKLLSEGGFNTKKGPIIQTAIIAATMAVKNTYNTIPLCHQIPITGCKVEINTTAETFDIRCRVKTNGQTGVEMEALHGVSVAALTIYDMCKAVGLDMIISDIHLEEKTGGKNDYQKKTQ